MIRFSFLAAAALLALAACGRDPAAATPQDPNAPGGGQGIVAGTLQVTVANRALVLKNQTEFPVGYLAIEANQAIVAMIPPCVGDACKKLVQGEQVTIPYAQISGYTNGAREAIVLWWKYVPGRDGQPVVNQMESTKVRL